MPSRKRPSSRAGTALGRAEYSVLNLPRRSGRSMVGSSPDARQGASKKSREWRPLQIIYLAAMAIVLFVVMFWAALGRPPLSGTNVEWVLGFFLVSLANLGLGTLVGGAIIEWRHPRWSRLGRLDHLFMALALLVLVGVDILALPGGCSRRLRGLSPVGCFSSARLPPSPEGAGLRGIPCPCRACNEPGATIPEGPCGRTMTRMHQTMSAGVRSPHCRCCSAVHSG